LTRLLDFLATRGGVFLLQIVYLVVLLFFGLAYWSLYPNQLRFPWSSPALPNLLGTVPIQVPWFGALGAVLISLAGVFQHGGDWRGSYRFWHWSRPIVGAAFAVVAVLIFQSGVLAAGSEVKSGSGENLLYVIAFLVGFREETFRELIKRVTDLIVAPNKAAATTTPPPTITSITPSEGPAAGTTPIALAGRNLAGSIAIHFGPHAAHFTNVSDTALAALSPAAAQPGPVPITVTTAAGPSTGKGVAFTHVA
jgi:hypothetical protein